MKFILLQHKPQTCINTPVMHNQLNKPYTPDHYHEAGTYRINVGSMFYVGSTTSFGNRRSQHKCDLQSGNHPNKKLQAAFDDSDHFEFIILSLIPRKPDDSDKDHAERLKFNEQLLLNAHKGDTNLANGSESARHNSTIGEYMKAKWLDPQFRDAQITRMKARRGTEISEETRRKMSEAKKGAGNPNSTPCEITLHGTTTQFQSVSEAAKYFGTTQQAMDHWMRGLTPWPGSSNRKPRPSTAHLIGMTGKLL